MYDDYYITQSFALKLTYEYLGEERIAYLEPYLFFINHYETIDKEHLKIYQYTL